MSLLDKWKEEPVPEPIKSVKKPKAPKKEPEPEQPIEPNEIESIYISSNAIRYFGEQLGVKSKILRESSAKTKDAIIEILQKAKFKK